MTKVRWVNVTNPAERLHVPTVQWGAWELKLQALENGAWVDVKVHLKQESGGRYIGMSERQLSPIERLACAVIDQHRNDGYPGDVDGGWLQEEMQRLGMLREVPVTESCAVGEHDNCVCEEYGEIPGNCTRLTPDMVKLMSVYRREESGVTSAGSGPDGGSL